MGYKMLNKIFPYLLFSIIFLSLTSCKDNAVEPLPSDSEYFWAGGQKVEVTINRKIVIGIYDPGNERKEGEIQVYRFISPQNSSLRNIVSMKGQNPDSFEWLSFGYTTNNGMEYLPTNTMSFKLKQDYTLDSLKEIIINAAVFDTTNYGTILIKVLEQDSNVFQTANKIYESGIVEYCEPNTLMHATIN